MKPVSFMGNSLDEIRSFPVGARRETGFQLERVQRGLDPDHWKPMSSIGAGVREIRVSDATGAFRTIYTATLSDAIYVLHAFQKKTQATSRRDIELAIIRCKELRRSRR